jgi:hypothetical protein
MSGFTNSGRLAIPICVTRPKGSLALRLTSSPSQAPASGSPRPPLSRLHGERASAMVSTFQLTRSTELCLTHRRTTIQESHRRANTWHSGRQELRQVRQVTAESPRLDRSRTETAVRSKRYADVLAFVSILKRSVQTARPRRARCPVSWSLPPDGMIVGRRTGRVFSVVPSGYPTVRRRQDFPASVELLMGCIHPSIPAWCQHVEAIKLSKQIITRKVTGDFFTLKPISENVQGIRLGCSLPDHGLGPLGG